MLTEEEAEAPGDWSRLLRVLQRQGYRVTLSVAEDGTAGCVLVRGKRAEAVSAYGRDAGEAVGRAVVLALGGGT